ITYAKSRFKNGQTNSAKMSRFLIEIDSAFITEESIMNYSSKETTKSAVDFWGSMREQRLKRENIERANIRQSVPQRKGNIVSVNNAASSMPLTQEAKELQVGNIIEHERFGRGEVTSIELNGNDRRAFVE